MANYQLALVHCSLIATAMAIEKSLDANKRSINNGETVVSLKNSADSYNKCTCIICKTSMK